MTNITIKSHLTILIVTKTKKTLFRYIAILADNWSNSIFWKTNAFPSVIFFFPFYPRIVLILPKNKIWTTNASTSNMVKGLNK